MYKDTAERLCPPPWSPQEDKLFEVGLVMFSEDDVPDKWFRIADMLPGRSPAEVWDHYELLVRDLEEIESGRIATPSYPDEDRGLAPDGDGGRVGRGKGGGTGRGRRERLGPGRSIGIMLGLLIVVVTDGIVGFVAERLFLVGLSKYGRGVWTSISRNVVMTRTPTQVASHAQKYYLRQVSSRKKERKRSSIHDITAADSATDPPPTGMINDFSC